MNENQPVPEDTIHLEATLAEVIEKLTKAEEIGVYRENQFIGKVNRQVILEYLSTSSKKKVGSNMSNILDVFQSRRSELFQAFFEHIQISFIALLFAVLISIPLGIYLTKKKQKLLKGLLE